MAVRSMFGLFLSLFVTLTWSASMRLPSYPLAVKTPYLSVWMPGHLSHDFPNATPQFWNGQQLTWIVMARINDMTYCLLGCTGGRRGTVQATQKSLNFTSTHTYVTLEAGSTELTMDFFSPVDPVNHVRQSLPFSYLTISTTHQNDSIEDIGLTSAIDASWLAGRGRPVTTFETVNGTKILTLDGEDGREFSEDRQMALWGKVVLATKVDSEQASAACQIGSPEAVTNAFVQNGSLSESVEALEYGSFAACSSSISASKHNRVTFAVGLHQDNEMQYFDGKKIEYYVGYFKTVVSNLTETVVYFLDDFKAALRDSHTFDQRIVDIGRVTSSNYSDLLEFTVRQSFAGQQVMINNDTLDTKHAYSFIKEISTDGNVNTLADLIPKALPVFHVLNPEYTRMMLEPVLRFSKHAWPLNHAVHDIGKSYPNATGETPCIEEFLPLDSTSVLLWMLYLYQSSTGYTDLTLDYAPILRTYANYCHRYGLYPVLQRSSVDALGSATNQSALSVSAAIALNAYGKMTSYSNYTDLGLAMAEKILEVGRDANQTHFLTHYTDEDEAWVLMYPLAFDAWLGLETFPRSVYEAQSDWYAQHTYPFGVQYRHNIRYTLMEWIMWVGAVSSNSLRDHLVNAVHMFLNQETGPRESVPGPTQWRVVPGPDEGVWTYFSKAKSVVGSIWMIAGVQGGFNSTNVAGAYPAVPNRPQSLNEAPALLAQESAHTLHDDQPQSALSVHSTDFGIPFEIPVGASKPIDPAFLGLSFDTASFPKYMGNSTAPNSLSLDLIRNLVTTSGAGITVRIGSPEGDFSIYDPIQFDALERVDVSGRSTLSVGPSFFDGIRAMNSIVRLDWIYQVPFAPYDIINAVAGARQAIDAVPNGRVYALEIGHKSNLYAGSVRPKNYGCQKYAAELFDFKIALRRNIGRIETQFQALGLSHRHIDDSWTMEECFTAGIKAQEDLKTVSVHYSHFDSSSDLKKSKLPRHDAIVHEHKAFLPQVDYMSNIFPCHAFVITEASLVTTSENTFEDSGSKPDDETTLGIAMWNLDFLLYALSKNVSKVLMHQSCDSMFSAWTPDACNSAKAMNSTSGKVNAPYSALTFAASFVNGARDFRVVPVHESDKTVTYAGYQNGKLSKIAIVNYPSHHSEEDIADNSSELTELKMSAEVLSLKQTARIQPSNIAIHPKSSTFDSLRGSDGEQVPMREQGAQPYKLEDGLLTVQMKDAGAILLEVR